MNKEWFRMELSCAQIEQLLQIARGDWRQRPVWDGNLTCKLTRQQLDDKGLVVRAHGYSFPTSGGDALAKKLLCLLRLRPDTMMNEALTKESS